MVNDMKFLYWEDEWNLNKDEKKENEYPDGQRRELFGKRAVEIGKKKDAD